MTSINAVVKSLRELLIQIFFSPTRSQYVLFLPHFQSVLHSCDEDMFTFWKNSYLRRPE